MIETYLYPILTLLAGWYLANHARKHTAAIINSFIQLAEERIVGTKMGPERKKWVIAQLKAAGIVVTKRIDTLIENLVEIMNERQK